MARARFLVERQEFPLAAATASSETIPARREGRLRTVSFELGDGSRGPISATIEVGNFGKSAFLVSGWTRHIGGLGPIMQLAMSWHGDILLRSTEDIDLIVLWDNRTGSAGTGVLEWVIEIDAKEKEEEVPA